MGGPEFIFYLLSFVAVLMAAGVVLARNPVHSAFFLVISFLNVAGIYAMLGAEFLAAVQVIVYTGAIMVVFLFVIMLVRPEDLGELSHGAPLQSVIAWILGIGLFAEIATVITSGIVTGQRGQQGLDQIAQVGGNTQAIGRILYSEYLLPFEAASLILLVATVAAIVLGIPEKIIRVSQREAGFNISLVHTREVEAIEAPDLDMPGTVDVEAEPVVAGGRSHGGVRTVGE